MANDDMNMGMDDQFDTHMQDENIDPETLREQSQEDLSE